MNIAIAVVLLVLLVVEAIISADFGTERPRPRWLLILNGGILVLLIVFMVTIIGRAINILGVG